jgi:hypothetical protein
MALSDLLCRFDKERHQQRGFRASTRFRLGASGRLMDVPGSLPSHGRDRVVFGDPVSMTEAPGSSGLPVKVVGYENAPEDSSEARRKGGQTCGPRRQPDGTGKVTDLLHLKR